MIKHCEDHGRNVFPLRKAAKAGAGGGLGPQFPGKGGIRPSYMAQVGLSLSLLGLCCETLFSLPQFFVLFCLLVSFVFELRLRFVTQSVAFFNNNLVVCPLSFLCCDELFIYLSISKNLI